MKNKILLSFSLISFFITFSSLIQADEAHDISNPENVEETLLGPSLNPSLMMLNSGSRIKGGSLAPIGEEIKDGEEWIEENIFQEENEATVTTVNSSSSQIARISSQIRPQSSSFQLTNVTAELSEQNEDKNEIIQSVKTEIQNNILLTETVNVAISVLQRKSEIQNALRIKRPDIDWDCTDMGSYILEQLREKLHEQYELEAAASLLHDKPTSVFLKNLNQDKSVAEKFEITAKEADIKARGIRTNALKYNLDQEFEAYQIAQDGWINVVSAYQCLLARAKIAQASGNIQESFNSEFFITSLKQAEAKESLWRAHAFWITVQQTETTITSSKGSLNADDASNLEIAWDKLVEAYEIAIKYDCATQDDNELIELLRQARTKKIYWSDQLSTFKFTSPTAIQNRKRSLASLLKSLQNRKTLLDRSARNTIWSKINQPSYQNWSLPEELLEVTTFGKETKEEKVGEVKKIMPPEVLDEECEVIGRQSLRQLNKIHLREKNISTEMPLDSFQQETKVSTILSRKDTYDPEEVIAAILEESFNPTERNKIRWDARAKADQWIDIAAEAGRRYQEAQEKKSGKVGIKGDNITDDGKSEFSEQQSFLDRRSKAVFWKPKLSMKGSKAGSSEGSRAGDTLKKTSKNLLIGTDLPNLSIPEKPTYEDLRTVDEAADQAKETWRALVLQAEQKRLSQPSTVKFLSKEIEEAWFKSDQKALKRQLEKIEQEKTELLAIELRESWERNSLRWKARSEADSLTKKSEELENKAQELDKEAINLLAQKMALKKEFGNQEKEESLQRKIKSTENEAKKTHNEAAEVQADATAAENTWINLAFTSNFFIESYKKGEDNGKKGFQQLRKSDQAVNKLWDEVKRLYNNNKLTNCPDLVLEEDDETNGTKEEYKTLLEAHQQDLQKLFEGDLDVKIAKANDLFRQGTVDSKDKADQLYQKIEQDEKKTLENYKATLKQEALRAAQKRITGAQEVLAERSIISKEQQEATKAFSKSTSNNSWEENKAQRNLKRATAVAEADETALQHFQEEEERLANIETLWMAIIEAKNKEILSERAKTARMYYEGNKKAWESLSSEAREEYNTEIIKINDEYKDAIKKNLDLATERAERARRYYNNTYFVLAFKAKAQALKAAEKAEADLEVLKTKAKERTEAIELAKLPSEQRDVKMKEKKYTENETKIKEKANAFIAQANTVADSAEATKAKAINASNEQIVNSWNEAIQSSKAAVTTWEEIISVLKQCRKEVPPLHQDLAWWNTQIEKAQTQQSDWEKKTVQYEDEKNETLKTKVSILSSKVIKAVKAAETAYTTAKTTNTASIKQKADCWNTTIQSSNSGVTAYTTAITALIQGSNEVSQSRQNLKVWWTTEIQKAQEQKSVWEENIVKYEKEKNDVLKNMAVTFLSQADRTTTSAHTAYNTANTVITISDQKVSLWNTAIRSSNNAVTNWIEAISTLQEGLKEVSQSCQDLKVWWTTELENAKNKKNEWSAVILRCKAKKEECVVCDAVSKANIASGEEAASLWKKTMAAVDNAEMAWTTTVTAYKEGIDQSPKRLKPSWENFFENIKEEQSGWITQKGTWQKERRICLAEFIKKKAIDIEKIANNATYQANIITQQGTKATASAWKTALNLAQDAMNEWGEIFSKYTDEKNKALTQEDKIYWSSESEYAQNQKNRWTARVLWRVANQAKDAAEASKIKAASVPEGTAESIQEWEYTLDLALKAQGALTQTINCYKTSKDNAFMPYQDEWNKALEKLIVVENNLQTWVEGIRYSTQNTKEKVAVEAKKLWDQAELETQGVSTLENNIFYHPQFRRSSYWDEIIQKAHIAEQAWIQVIKTYKESSEKVPKQINKDWNAAIQKAEQNQASFASKIVNLEKKKNEALQEKITELRSKIKKDEKFANDTVTKASIASGKEAVSLWEEAMKAVDNAEMAWTTTVTAYEQGIDQNPEQLKPSWREFLKNIKEEQSAWTTQKGVWQKEREICLAEFIKKEAEDVENAAECAKEEALKIQPTQQGTKVSADAWDKALNLAQNAMHEWEKVILFYENNLVEQEYAQNQKNRWTAKILWRVANKTKDAADASKIQADSFPEGTAESVEAWTGTLKLAQEAEKILKEAMNYYTTSKDNALPKYQNEWEGAIIKLNIWENNLSIWIKGIVNQKNLVEFKLAKSNIKITLDKATKASEAHNSAKSWFFDTDATINNAVKTAIKAKDEWNQALLACENTLEKANAANVSEADRNTLINKRNDVQKELSKWIVSEAMAEFEKAKWYAESSWNRAQRISCIAKNKIPLSNNSEHTWDDAAETANQAKETWRQVLEAYGTVLEKIDNLVHIPQVIRNVWISNIKEVLNKTKFEEAKWTVQSDWAQAEVKSTIACYAVPWPWPLSFINSESTWNKAVETAKEAKTAWDQVIQAYKIILERVEELSITEIDRNALEKAKKQAEGKLEEWNNEVAKRRNRF